MLSSVSLSRTATRAAAPGRAARAALATSAPRRATTVAAAAAGPVEVPITMHGRHMQVTPALRDYIQRKLSRAIAHSAPAVRRVDVTLSARGGDTGTHGAKEQRVGVTITTLRGEVVRLEDAEESMYASVDVVCDKVRAKLRKMKERAVSTGAWSGRAAVRAGAADAEFKAWMDAVAAEAAAFDEERARAGAA